MESEADWIMSGEPGPSVLSGWRGAKFHPKKQCTGWTFEYSWRSERNWVGVYTTLREGVRESRKMIDKELDERDLFMRFATMRIE